MCPNRGGELLKVRSTMTRKAERVSSWPTPLHQHNIQLWNWGEYSKGCIALPPRKITLDYATQIRDNILKLDAKVNKRSNIQHTTYTHVHVERIGIPTKKTTERREMRKLTNPFFFCFLSFFFIVVWTGIRIVRATSSGWQGLGGLQTSCGDHLKVKRKKKRKEELYILLMFWWRKKKKDFVLWCYCEAKKKILQKSPSSWGFFFVFFFVYKMMMWVNGIWCGWKEWKKEWKKGRE